MQRTKNVRACLDLLGEQNVTHVAEEPFGAAEGDTVFHTYPPIDVDAARKAHAAGYPGIRHVECGVGYDVAPHGPIRVYESEAWRHHCWGKYGSTLEERQQSAVIPWAFDLSEWPLGEGTGGYVSYLGRLFPDKGIKALFAAATALPKLHFKVASTDDRCGLHGAPSNVEYVGPILGTARAKFLGAATVHLCPTEFVEPLNGSAIEAMLCGTPVVSSAWGGFTETVVEGASGFRCSSGVEIVDGIRRAPGLDRGDVRHLTRRFSIEATAVKWKRFLSRNR